MTTEAADDTRFDLEDRLLTFSARVIRLVERLPRTRAGNHAAGQLLRCGTSPFPNHAEAQSAESREDFIHKMMVCLKQLRETRRWLLLIRIVPLVKPASKTDLLLQETEELIRIFVTSVRTARRNKGGPRPVPSDR